MRHKLKYEFKMIEQLIKERMQTIGLTQAKLAELSGCTPTQMGLFLKSEASLNRETLDKCLKVLGVDLSINLKRLDIARQAAAKLSDIPIDEIKNMGKHTMVKVTGISEIECLPDPNESEFENMISSGIYDYEGTFPFFKSLVLHFRNLCKVSPTPKTVQNSFETITKQIPLSATGLASAGIVMAAGLMPSLIGVAIGALMTNSVYAKASTNSWAPLLTITKGLLKKE